LMLQLMMLRLMMLQLMMLQVMVLQLKTTLTAAQRKPIKKLAHAVLVVAMT